MYKKLDRPKNVTLKNEDIKMEKQKNFTDEQRERETKKMVWHNSVEFWRWILTFFSCAGKSRQKIWKKTENLSSKIVVKFSYA